MFRFQFIDFLFPSKKYSTLEGYHDMRRRADAKVKFTYNLAYIRHFFLLNKLNKTAFNFSELSKIFLLSPRISKT